MATLEEISAKLDMVLAKLDGQRRQAPANNGEPVFPNYGRSKGQPVRGADIGDLEFYASGCRRTLDDPNKSQYHAKDRALLLAIEEEIQRQNGDGPDPLGEFPPEEDDDGIPF
jgi:hypothetical protein